MSEMQRVERAPRRSDFCGCPPCGICYEWVVVDGQKAPSFEESMKEIYGEGPRPQTEQEYEWAHAAAHQCRQEEATRPQGGFFEAEDRARMTQMQIDDLLKKAKRAAEAPKPLNTVNLDNMPLEVVEARLAGVNVKKEVALEYMKEKGLAYLKAKEGQMKALDDAETNSVSLPVPSLASQLGLSPGERRY